MLRKLSLPVFFNHSLQHEEGTGIELIPLGADEIDDKRKELHSELIIGDIDVLLPEVLGARIFDLGGCLSMNSDSMFGLIDINHVDIRGL